MTTQEQNAWQVSLKEYVDLRFVDLQRAVDKAETAMTLRLAILNEFKDTYMKAQKEFATKEMIVRIENDIRELRSIADENKGKANQTTVLIYGAIAIVGLILSIVRLLK